MLLRCFRTSYLRPHSGLLARRGAKLSRQAACTARGLIRLTVPAVAALVLWALLALAATASAGRDGNLADLRPAAHAAGICDATGCRMSTDGGARGSDNDTSEGATAADDPVSTRFEPGGAPRHVRFVVQYVDPEAAEAAVSMLGGHTVRRLPHVGAMVVRLPADRVDALRGAPGVGAVSLDRSVTATVDHASAVVGAARVHDELGFDGTGVGVAIIDSGVARAHMDLEPNRVAHFMDFVRGQPLPYDGYGHGTHVAGIVAGNGYQSGGARRGIAPGAHLIVLKTLDERGHGYITDAIAAIDYAIEHQPVFNIRVLNLSVAAGVYESYRTDPLALAAARAVEAGMVVVTAAGNLGRSARGAVQHGGITAPGNAPWVLTVGAADDHGTYDRSDDSVAPFSSLGPSAIDASAKPDLVAPGTDLTSLADPGSTLFLARPASRVWGAFPAGHEPYLSLSGTSMAAPVVAGAVAVMLQANPSLTPAAVKNILRNTADPLDGFAAVAQGAGMLDMRTAVAVAAALVGGAAAEPTEDVRP